MEDLDNLVDLTSYRDAKRITSCTHQNLELEPLDSCYIDRADNIFLEQQVLCVDCGFEFTGVVFPSTKGQTYTFLHPDYIKKHLKNWTRKTLHASINDVEIHRKFKNQVSFIEPKKGA